MLRPPPTSTLFPYTTLFRSERALADRIVSSACEAYASPATERVPDKADRSEEHTSELQSRGHLVCRLLLEKKNKKRDQLDARRSSRWDYEDEPGRKALGTRA